MSDFLRVLRVRRKPQRIPRHGNLAVADAEETAEVDESDDREPVWKIEIKYKNGTDQTIQDYDGILDQVEELFYEFNDYFEDELFENDFDDGDDEDGEYIEINEFYEE